MVIISQKISYEYCLIPARVFIQRIPKKNIKKFCGKPIISYSIKTAKNLKFLIKKKYQLIAKKADVSLWKRFILF